MSLGSAPGFWKLELLGDQGHSVQPHPLFQAGLHFRCIPKDFPKCNSTSPLPGKSTLELLSGRLWNGPESQLAHVSAPFPPKTLTIRSYPGVGGMKQLWAQPQQATGQVHLR